MEIGDWKAVQGLGKLYRQARELGLETNLAELEAFGFTVIEPDKLGPRDLARRLLDATLEAADKEDLSVVRLNQLANGVAPATGRQLFHLLYRDPAYLDALMHPAVLTMGSYLTGLSNRLYSMVAFIKDGHAAPTHVHSDSSGVPPPLPSYGNVCNVSWILTDYTVENGTFFFVPGSHRYCRHPSEIEQPKFLGGAMDDEMGVPAIAEAGSLVVFHGNTWHGTYPKTTDGLRLHVATAFSRNFINPAEDYGDASDDLIEKGGPRLARLLGRDAWQGYRREGPDFMNMIKLRGAQQSHYG